MWSDVRSPYLEAATWCIATPIRWCEVTRAGYHVEHCHAQTVMWGDYSAGYHVEHCHAHMVMWGDYSAGYHVEHCHAHTVMWGDYSAGYHVEHCHAHTVMWGDCSACYHVERCHAHNTPILRPQIVNLLEMVRTSVSHSHEAAALFYDELARIIEHGQVDPKVQARSLPCKN